MERRYVEEKYYAGSDFTAQEDRWSESDSASPPLVSLESGSFKVI
jgi:hypothetical protein